MIVNCKVNIYFNRDSFIVLRIAPLLKFRIVCFNKNCLVAKVIIACLFKFLIVFFFFKKGCSIGVIMVWLCGYFYIKEYKDWLLIVFIFLIDLVMLLIQIL